jgi:hypothetical protein
MIFGEPNILIGVAVLVLAMALGSLGTLIAIELRKRARQRPRPGRFQPETEPSEEEKRRRQEVVVRLMSLYSGVHSADALSDFLNRELERRQENWRVRIPSDGPGEIYDLEPG